MTINKQALREAAQEEIMLRSVSDTSDYWQDEAGPEAVLALLDELEAAEKRIAELEKSEEQLINERDHAESALADMYFAATGDRPEWSNWFGFSDAVDTVVDRIADLEAKQPSPVSVPDERAAFETFMEKRFKDCIDRRLVKNGDGEYSAWDMQVAWIVWQERASMLHGSEPVQRWIPCSEQMPTKQDAAVFLTWNGQYIGKELFLMGSFQCLKPEIITHWMPLPAAPQQEVK